MGATVVRSMLQKPWTDRAKRSIVRPSVSTWRSAMRADPRKNDCATVTSTTATLPPPRHSHSRYSSSVCLPANWRTPAADLTYSKWPKLNLQMKTMMIIITSTECGLLLQTSWCSVVSVCLSVKSTSEPRKNGWTNRDCAAHSRGPKDHVLGPTRGPHGKHGGTICAAATTALCSNLLSHPETEKRNQFSFECMSFNTWQKLVNFFVYIK